MNGAVETTDAEGEDDPELTVPTGPDETMERTVLTGAGLGTAALLPAGAVETAEEVMLDASGLDPLGVEATTVEWASLPACGEV